MEKSLDTETPASNTLNKILKFVEINQDIFIHVKKAAISLDSIGAKVKHLAGNEQLIEKLRHYVNRLIPSEPQEKRDFLQLIRNTIVDPSERLQAIADWVNFMRIPLAQLDLTEEEFILVTKLEDPNFDYFNFLSLNWNIVTRKLLTPDLKFKTKEVNFLSTLARLCSQYDASSIAKYIHNFAISDESARIEIAKFCAQRDGKGSTAEHIKNFAISDEGALVEIAKLCAKQNCGVTTKCIQNFAISGELARVEIAKFCAEEDTIGWTAEQIQNFAISDELSKIEIATLCAQKDGESTAAYIQNFKIEDELARIEIAKRCIQKNGEGMPKHIQNFAISDELARVEVAKLFAQKYGESTTAYIQSFTIGNEMMRIEIAKLCAQNDGEGTAKHIKNFTISDELARVEIAELCAQQSSGGMLRYIQNFSIADEEAMVKIAKLCAELNGRSTALYFQNFFIADESVRIEIAKMCAKQSRGVIALYIKNFSIVDEPARIEIAKICAHESGGWMVYNIGNFEIKDESIRIEIVKFCAHHDAGGTAEFIEYFPAGSEAVRIEIAKICAQRNGRTTALYYQNFSITDELASVEIAKLCAHQNSAGTAEFIDRFKLTNHHSLYLFLHCVQKDMKSLFHMNEISSLPKELKKIQPLMQILKGEAKDEPQRKKLFEEISNLIQKISISNECRKKIFEIYDRIKTLPLQVQNAATLWLVSFILCMREMKTDRVEWLVGTGVWSELALLKDPILRASLSSGLHALSAESDSSKFWDDFLSSVRGAEGQRGLKLLAIPFFNLQLQGIESCQLLAIANHLNTLQKKNASSLRNIYQVKNLLHTMQSLVSSTELTAEQKKRGFEKIFFDTSSRAMIHNEAQILKNVTAVKGLLQLKDARWPDATEKLGVLFRSSLEELIPLPQFKGDLSEKYEEIWGKCRNPWGLLTFAAGLKSLEEPSLLSCLGQYMALVMEATFKNKRYDTTCNPHLAKVLEGNPDVLSKWREEITLDMSAMISEDKKEDSFDCENWLRTKLLLDKHLDGEKLPYLMEYIKAPSESRKEIFSALLKEIKKLMTEGETEVLTLRKTLDEAEKKIKEIEANLKKDKGNEELVFKSTEEKKGMKENIINLTKRLKAFSVSRANDSVWVNLNLQKACLKFAEEGKVSDRKSLVDYLEKINQSLTFYKTSEFAMDVKGLLETFKNQAEASSDSNLKAVFTDDPIDLLLCGTDISGSCQRLDGNPKLNKGLLGYLIDGKNRLLAIKDGEKIVARCMLKLLWDGKQPVVYRERFYPDQIPDAYKKALNILAKQVSQKLAVPLTFREGSLSYNNTLHGLGGPAPYEYSDGAGGVQKEGRYTIEAKILD